MQRQIEITENLQQTMEERYYYKDANETTPQQMVRRVANFVAEGEKLYGWGDTAVKFLADEYYDTINRRLWIPSSPFLMNAGTKRPMVFACFVVGGLKDDMEAIYDTLKRQGMINKLGGGTGFNFSILREEGSQIASTGGTSSGVMSFMELFNTNGDVVKQGGRRRSANMGVLRCNHPEIMKFINYKANLDKLNNFNISMMTSDEFMECVLDGREYELVSPKGDRVVGTAKAKDVFNQLVYRAWQNGEPAMLFLDNINRDNPMVEYMGFIVTTNPCGEITLYEDEACDLASINLEEFVDWEGNVDWDLLRYVTRLGVRFLDTAIDVNLYPDKTIEDKVKSLRRLGLGIMSLHGALIKKGVKYSSKAGRDFAERLMGFINNEAFLASCQLAEEKGVFPLWEHSSYAKDDIRIRNVARTTIAPTGTIQQILNTSSSGCEPIFALTYARMINGIKTYWVNPFFIEHAKHFGYWFEELPELINENKGKAKGVDLIPYYFQDLFETAMEIAPLDHVYMQGALQKHIDNSISKTINLPKEATVEDVREAFLVGWSLGCKGLTVYRDGSRMGQVLSVDTDEVEGTDKPDRVDEYYAELEKEHLCPQCGSPLIVEGGCEHCTCGWGKCSV